MKAGGFVSDILTKAGVGTDQMTTADKILDSKFLKLTPFGLVNAIGAKKSDAFSKDEETFNQLYENFDAFSLNSISKYASELNMDATQFSTLLKDKATRAAVVDSKKEGLKNTVASTPTFFINGHKVEGIFDVDSMISMLEEAIEKNP